MTFESLVCHFFVLFFNLLKTQVIRKEQYLLGMLKLGSDSLGIDKLK